MTRGARTLLAFMRFRGGAQGQCWWKQSTISRQLDCHRSSVIRWVAELVKDGALASVRRGSMGNLYTLTKCGPRQGELSQNATSDVAKSDKLSYLQNKNPERAKPPISPEQQNLPEVQAALRKARGRIERAKNPRAYTEAIIRAESSHGAVATSPAVAPSFSTLHRLADRQSVGSVSKETVTDRFLPKPEELEGLEEFAREHEARRLVLMQASKAPNSAPISGGATEVKHVQPVPRPGILRRPPERDLRRAVEVVSLPGFARSPEQHARTG